MRVVVELMDGRHRPAETSPMRLRSPICLDSGGLAGTRPEGWHRGEHDPWPAIDFLLYSLKEACKEFEERVGQLRSPRGEKTAMVLAAIDRQVESFRVADLQSACPGVNVDLIRLVLDRLRKEKKLSVLEPGAAPAGKRRKLGINA